MLRVLRAIVLYLVFMFLTVLVVAWAIDDIISLDPAEAF